MHIIFKHNNNLLSDDERYLLIYKLVKVYFFQTNKEKLIEIFEEIFKQTIEYIANIKNADITFEIRFNTIDKNVVYSVLNKIFQLELEDIFSEFLYLAINKSLEKL